MEEVRSEDGVFRLRNCNSAFSNDNDTCSSGHTLSKSVLELVQEAEGYETWSLQMSGVGSRKPESILMPGNSGSAREEGKVALSLGEKKELTYIKLFHCNSFLTAIHMLYNSLI